MVGLYCKVIHTYWYPFMSNSILCLNHFESNFNIQQLENDFEQI